MFNRKRMEVHNENNSVVVEFSDYAADVTINGKEKIITGYNPDLNLDEAAKKLTNALIKESRRPSLYSDIFPSFGRDFKIMVSSILKARA